MKKQYISPAQLVCVLSTDTQLCIGSPVANMDDDLPELENGDPTDRADSRRQKDLWAEEEEEEY